MEGEAWGFNAIDFEPNIDDSENFDLSIAAKTANDLDLPYLRKHWTRDQAISDHISLPAKTRKATQWAVSVRVSCVV